MNGLWLILGICLLAAVLLGALAWWERRNARSEFEPVRKRLP